MKTMMTLSVALMAAGLHADTLRLANGLEFRIPVGWQATRTENGAVLMPPNAVSGSEAYIVALLPNVTDIQDPRLLAKLAAQYSSSGVHGVASGSPVSFQSAGGPGFIHSYDFVENGQRGRLQFYLVALPTGGAAAVVAAGTRELIPLRSVNVLGVASSLRQTVSAAPSAAPTTAATYRLDNGSALAQQWMQRLSGKKLMQFSSYSSGSSGGYSSQRTLYLATDGSYAFRTSSSVSVYVPGATGGSSGRNGSDGQWRIFEQSGKPMLELQSAQTGKEVIVLSTDGSKTFLNGHRWLVAPIQ